VTRRGSGAVALSIDKPRHLPKFALASSTHKFNHAQLLFGRTEGGRGSALLRHIHYNNSKRLVRQQPQHWSALLRHIHYNNSKRLVRQQPQHWSALLRHIHHNNNKRLDNSLNIRLRNNSDNDKQQPEASPTVSTPARPLPPGSFRFQQRGGAGSPHNNDNSNKPLCPFGWTRAPGEPLGLGARHSIFSPSIRWRPFKYGGGAGSPLTKTHHALWGSTRGHKRKRPLSDAWQPCGIVLTPS
jgi:hypothetical protein